MEIDDVVLAIDAERERISLGIKQIEKDPFSAYLAQHEKGSIVKGTVLKIEPQGITDNLAAGGGGLYPNVGIIA
jgi:small subunit ribosomal protein S1